MAGKKKVVIDGAVQSAAPDSRTKERKAIDRGLRFVDRARLLMRHAVANLEDAADISGRPAGLSDEDMGQLRSLRDACRKLMRHLPAGVDLIGEISGDAEEPTLRSAMQIHSGA